MDPPVYRNARPPSWRSSASAPIGYGIASAVSRARYDEVWAVVVVVTLASIVLYALVSAVEAALKRRSGI